MLIEFENWESIFIACILTIWLFLYACKEFRKFSYGKYFRKRRARRKNDFKTTGEVIYKNTERNDILEEREQQSRIEYLEKRSNLKEDDIID